MAIVIVNFYFFSFSGQSSAIDGLKVMIGSVKGKTGQLVTVPISIENVAQGIGSYNLQLDFHSEELEVIKVTPSYGDSGDYCDNNIQGCFYSNFDNSQGWIRTLWLDTSGDNPLTSEKQLFTITFKIKSTSVGTKPITIDQSKDSTILFSDENIQKLPSTVTNGEVLVESDSSSGGASNSDRGGNSGGGRNPSPGGTIRQGDVGLGNGNTTDPAVKVDIVRQTENNKKVDQVYLDNKTTEDTVKKALELKQELINIRIPDLLNDPAEEVSVKIPKQSVSQLSDTNVSLNIQTDDVSIQLPKESIQGLDGKANDLFFRVVPIRKEDEKKQVFENTLNAEVVKELAGNNEVQVLGKPMTIETNYQNQKTLVTFSLKDITLPNDLVEKESFLKNLAVFIQHSDGEKVVQKGKIKYDSAGKPVGIEIEITKFSTFTIVELPNSAPTASRVSVSGKAKVGEKVKGVYSYKDLENDPQGKSTFKWYRANNAKGTNKERIAGATKSIYTLTSKDRGKYISFEVVPVAKIGTVKGVKAASSFIGPVKATVVKDTGHFKVGVIQDKAYAKKLASILEKTYKGKNVTIKKVGKYYLVTANFVNKKRAIAVGKNMKKKKLVTYYSVK